MFSCHPPVGRTGVVFGLRHAGGGCRSNERAKRPPPYELQCWALTLGLSPSNRPQAIGVCPNCRPEEDRADTCFGGLWHRGATRDLGEIYQLELQSLTGRGMSSTSDGNSILFIASPSSSQNWGVVFFGDIHCVPYSSFFFLLFQFLPF